MDMPEIEPNIGQKQRLLSTGGGLFLLVVGSQKRGLGGMLAVVAGLGLIARGVSGYCPFCKGGACDVSDKNRSELTGATQPPGHDGELVKKSVVINKSPQELYDFWRDFTNLPRIMDHLESVEKLSNTRSKWTAKAPLGQTVTWEAEINKDEPGKMISWQSVEGSTVDNSGSVRFLEASNGRGTEVNVTLKYSPPAGAVGVAVAKLLGEDPQKQIDDDLKKFQQLMETGEITTNGRES